MKKRLTAKVVREASCNLGSNFDDGKVFICNCFEAERREEVYALLVDFNAIYCLTPELSTHSWAMNREGIAPEEHQNIRFMLMCFMALFLETER